MTQWLIDSTLHLADGRVLGYCVGGDPNGFPVVSIHGTPGCRYSRHYDPALYVHHGVKMITYDRPGYGRSSRLRGRSVADAAADVEALVDALGIKTFPVTGGSGGGPHGLAVAALLGDRVHRAACVVGVAPYGADGLDFFAGMTKGNVDEFGWAVEGEAVLVRGLEPVCREILAAVESSTGLGAAYDLSDDDLAVFRLPERQAAQKAAMREALVAGIYGAVDDDLAMVKPWGFDLSSIAVPVQVIYGRTDTLVPPQHGRWLAAHVPRAEEIMLEGGHFALHHRLPALLDWLKSPLG